MVHREVDCPGNTTRRKSSCRNSLENTGKGYQKLNSFHILHEIKDHSFTYNRIIKQGSKCEILAIIQHMDVPLLYTQFSQRLYIKKTIIAYYTYYSACMHRAACMPRGKVIGLSVCCRCHHKNRQISTSRYLSNS